MELEKVFKFPPIADVREIPIDNFAYIGDAVIALRYKLHILGDGRIKANELNNNSKNYLSAKAHSVFVDRILDFYNEEEQAIYKRALNSKGAKKRGNDEAYRKSTGFEAVIGYLYLTRQFGRIDELLEVIDKCISTEEMS